jgi:uncharacterized membrane protein (UPF0127 family)
VSLVLALSLSPIAAAALDLATIRVGHQALTVEVAGTRQERARGLMGREWLAPDGGMLFDFERWGRHAIWMKNTLIPLDILWLDGGGTVVHIQGSAQPCRADPCPIYQPDRDARYVLELAGGGARRLGVRVGDRLDLDPGAPGGRPSQGPR